MTKDVLITISGVQILDEEDDDVEMVTRGDYYNKNGKHYITYDEVMEGFAEPVKNIIKVSPGSEMCIRDRPSGPLSLVLQIQWLHIKIVGSRFKFPAALVIS